MDETHVVGAYDRLLASIGNHAADIGDRPVVTHWPHVGSAYSIEVEAPIVVIAADWVAAMPRAR